MGSNLRDFLEGRLLWFGELVLCGSGPWIIRWLGRLPVSYTHLTLPTILRV